MKDKLYLIFEYIIGFVLVLLSLLFVGALVTLAYGFCAIWFVFYPLIIVVFCVLISVVSILNILFKTIKRLGGFKD